MPAFRSLVAGMLPRVDFPELLLEVAELTGLPAAFTHVTGADARLTDFEVSICALILAEACNVGLVPVVKPGLPALTRGRLAQIDQGYFRAETIAAANVLLLDTQAKIDLVRAWGGGLVAARGLLARILYALPPNTVGRRRVGAPLPAEDITAAYADHLRRLVLTLADWTDPAVLPLAPAADHRVLEPDQT
jgi:hypothetical protein